jgi:hypothetical protein
MHIRQTDRQTSKQIHTAVHTSGPQCTREDAQEDTHTMIGTHSRKMCGTNTQFTDERDFLMHVSMHKKINSHAHAHACTRAHAHACEHAHAQTQSYTNTHMHAHAHKYMHTYARTSTHSPEHANTRYLMRKKPVPSISSKVSLFPGCD